MASSMERASDVSLVERRRNATQAAAQSRVQLTSDQVHDAVALRRTDARRVHELAADAFQERLARRLDPASSGRAVYVVERAELVDVEAVQHVLAQEQPVAGRQRVEGALKRGLEERAVLGLHQRELGILGARRVLLEPGVIALIAAAEQLETETNGRDFEPAPQIPARRVFGDLGTPLGSRNEELFAQALPELSELRRAESQPTERRRDLWKDLGFEDADRGLAAPGRGEGQVEVAEPRAGQLGRFFDALRGVACEVQIVDDHAGKFLADGAEGSRDFSPRVLARLEALTRRCGKRRDESLLELLLLHRVGQHTPSARSMSDVPDPRSSPKRTCPDDESIAAFVAGEQGSAERSELEAHFAECNQCRRVVSALAPDVVADEAVDALDPTVASGVSGRESQGLRSGQVIDGRYAVETLLGAGGMGVLARARHRVLGTSVVIKLLRAPEVDEETLHRFLREARAGAALDSAFVARVLDAGIMENGRPYLVLEHLEGSDFAELLSKSGPLSVPDAVRYALQAAEALSVAHSRGIVHRDIKPANLFLADSTDGSRMLKVLDFGIAKAAEDSGFAETSGDLTGTAAVMGSPRYMSPEQLEHSAGVDARTDIWSLGAVLYELLSGEPAFDGPNVAGLAAAILTRQPRPLRELRDDIPPKLAAVVARCLAKKRDERFASMAELADALAPHSPEDALPLVARIRRISEKSHSSMIPASREPTPGRRLDLRWLALAGAGAAVVLVFVSLRRPPPSLLHRGLVDSRLSLPLAPAPAASEAIEATTASALQEPGVTGPRPALKPVSRSSTTSAPSPASSTSDLHRPGLGDRK